MCVGDLVIVNHIFSVYDHDAHILFCVNTHKKTKVVRHSKAAVCMANHLWLKLSLDKNKKWLWRVNANNEFNNS